MAGCGSYINPTHARRVCLLVHTCLTTAHPIKTLARTARELARIQHRSSQTLTMPTTQNKMDEIPTGLCVTTQARWFCHQCDGQYCSLLYRQLRLSGRYSTDFSNCPISDGLRVVLIPQASMISSLASAVSSPPEIRAPA